ncbi:peroxide stress protein YaaA [Curtobacterium sp. MCPF17_052]|nr:peroxide stress protein YaaA [Curtobacterium sp. MCPF17_052]WIB14049.1 peroxide stress protein YaaA [Curtobacterium sp. MCPF17_052]
MTVLLPPSETKREGGDTESSLDLGELSFPELATERAAVITAARSVSSEESSARTALKLGPKSVAERLRNMVLETSPTMPAVERYTGVLYDPLDALTADAGTRAWWDRHVVVQSAMFGPVGAGDRIPRVPAVARFPAPPGSGSRRTGLFRHQRRWRPVRRGWSSTSGRRATARSRRFRTAFPCAWSASPETVDARH